MSKAREFWIAERSMLAEPSDYYDGGKPHCTYGFIHVREVLPDEITDTNQYKPWIELGLSVVEYWKMRYIESVRFISDLEDKLYHASREAPEVEYKLGHEIEVLQQRIKELEAIIYAHKINTELRTYDGAAKDEECP